MTSDRPIRKHPVHGVLHINTQPSIAFVTVCTQNKRRLLDNASFQDCVMNAWRQADAWLVGRYVIMPDHIHLFAGMMDERVELDRWVRYWKSLVTKSVNRADFKWQAGHWDTRMRNADQYESKWEYVKNNPVRHRLVEDAGDWSYAGIINSLGWD